jgi:hypothetical protein
MVILDGDARCAACCQNGLNSLAVQRSGHKGDSLDETKPPLPPFTPDAARHKVRAFGRRRVEHPDPDRGVLIYTEVLIAKSDRQFRWPLGRRPSVARSGKRECGSPHFLTTVKSREAAAEYAASTHRLNA